MFKDKTPKILIIEDDGNNHPLYRKAFEEAGFEVLISDNADGNFADGVVALAPDIISMDLMIGKAGKAAERDGFEAIEALKSDERTKEIPIMVASNFFQEEKIARARELGVNDYFNLQGHALSEIAGRFMEYVAEPKKYSPSHPTFQG